MCGIWNNDQPFPSTPKVMEVSMKGDLLAISRESVSRAVRPTNTKGRPGLTPFLPAEK